jgi:peptide subunit release factor 1 (eRF1)
MHVRWHLKRVAELAEELARDYGFDRLVLAGPVAATSELQGLLPKRLRSRVAGTVRLPVDARPETVLAETLALEHAVERAEEAARVEQLLTAAGKRNGGIAGLEPTLTAVRQRRVWRLLYAERFAAGGAECARCGALFPSGPAACTYCGAPVRPLDDVVERAVQRVAEAGGGIERVHGPAAVRLEQAGGIGALLRY